MKDEIALARGWFRKGDSDLAGAEQILDGEGPYDIACFHAQQAAEKYLKGFLALRQRPAPRTHNLEELQHVCLAQNPDLPLADLSLFELSGYAVEMRYDLEFWPDHETAEEAV